MCHGFALGGGVWIKLLGDILLWSSLWLAVMFTQHVPQGKNPILSAGPDLGRTRAPEVGYTPGQAHGGAADGCQSVLFPVLQWLYSVAVTMSLSRYTTCLPVVPLL